MSPIRLAVLLFTLLTLPVYGIAASTQRTCQEQMSSTSHATSQLGDCCPGKSDQSTPCKGTGAGSTCTSCKAGYSCKVPQSFRPTSVWTVAPLPVRAGTTTEVSSFLPSHSPDGLWRPPTLS